MEKDTYSEIYNMLTVFINCTSVEMLIGMLVQWIEHSPHSQEVVCSNPSQAIPKMVLSYCETNPLLLLSLHSADFSLGI